MENNTPPNTVILTEKRFCDFCKQVGRSKLARYDGKTTMGPWAYMCSAHMGSYGVGLGVGRGQKLWYRGPEFE